MIFETKMNYQVGVFANNVELQVTEPEFNGSNMTNRVLYSKVKSVIGNEENKKVKITYYLPAYVWIKIKNFNKLSIENL